MMRVLLIVCVGLCGWGWVAPVAAQPQLDLEAGFHQPPQEAKPSAYWLWLNGYANRDYFDTELRAFAEQGVGGAVHLRHGSTRLDNSSARTLQLPSVLPIFSVLLFERSLRKRWRPTQSRNGSISKRRVFNTMPGSFATRRRLISLLPGWLKGVACGLTWAGSLSTHRRTYSVTLVLHAALRRR